MAAHSIFISKFSSKRNSYFVLFFVCAFIVSINLISSQSYPAIMYELVQGNERARLEYLKKIWGSSLYNNEVNQIRDENRELLLGQIQAEEQERLAVIESLKSIIKKYPYAPEPYYNLSLLYRRQGDLESAGNYLKKAQQIDPTLQ